MNQKITEHPTGPRLPVSRIFNSRIIFFINNTLHSTSNNIQYIFKRLFLLQVPLLNSLLIFLTVCVIIIVRSFHLFLCIYRYHRLVTNISSYCARMSLSLCLSLFLLLFRAKSANKKTDTIFCRPGV